MSKFGDHFHEMQNDVESLKDRALEQKAVKSARSGRQQFLRRSTIDVYSNFRKYAHPSFYRKYAHPFSEGSFLKILL